MAKIKSIGLYDSTYQLVEAHSTKASANRSEAQYAHTKEFVYVYPSQLLLLGYAQAIDLETILRYADLYRYDENTKNKGTRIATI